MTSGRILRSAGREFFQKLSLLLKSSPGLKQLCAAGSYRRGVETIGDLDLLASTSHPESLMDRMSQVECMDRVLTTQSDPLVKTGVRVPI